MEHPHQSFVSKYCITCNFKIFAIWLKCLAQLFDFYITLIIRIAQMKVRLLSVWELCYDIYVIILTEFKWIIIVIYNGCECWNRCPIVPRDWHPKRRNSGNYFSGCGTIFQQMSGPLFFANRLHLTAFRVVQRHVNREVRLRSYTKGKILDTGRGLGVNSWERELPWERIKSLPACHVGDSWLQFSVSVK